MDAQCIDILKYCSHFSFPPLDKSFENLVCCESCGQLSASERDVVKHEKSVPFAVAGECRHEFSSVVYHGYGLGLDGVHVDVRPRPASVDVADLALVGVYNELEVFDGVAFDVKRVLDSAWFVKDRHLESHISVYLVRVSRQCASWPYQSSFSWVYGYFFSVSDCFDADQERGVGSGVYLLRSWQIVVVFQCV